MSYRADGLMWRYEMGRKYEADARRLIETVLGVPIVQHDFNSGRSVPDLRIDYPDRAGYVEVVADSAQFQWRALDRELDRGNRTLTVPGLRYDWFVYLNERVRVRKLAIRLPDLLHRLERAGELFDHRVDRHRTRSSSFAKEINRLGIDMMAAGREAVGDAQVNFVLSGAEGPATVDLARLVEWCGEFLYDPRRADVRRKLAETGAPERHVFVVVSWATEWAVLHALSRDARGMVPDICPPLPAEVTHLWLLGTGPADRLIAWLPDRGWIDYEFGPWHAARTTG